MEEEVMTYDEAYYLDIEDTKASNATANIQLMNVGVTKFEENANPKEKSSHYIGNKSPSNKLTGHDNQFSIESDLIKNDDVVMYLYDIFRNRKVGKYAQQDLFIVELWNQVSNNGTPVENTYKARKLLTTAVISGKTPTPGETITFSGDLKGVGDFVDGTFNTSTKTFTPNA